MRIIFASIFSLFIMCLNPVESKAATILRTFDFSTGFIQIINGDQVTFRQPISGSISTIFNEPDDIQGVLAPAIINSFSLPFSAGAFAEIRSISAGFNNIYGNPNGFSLSNTELDFAIFFLLDSPAGFFEFFDPSIGRRITEPLVFSRITDVSLVPEPALWVLFLIGFGCIGHALRVRQNLKSTSST